MTIDFIFGKVTNEEGSSEPFCARLWIGILELRDDALRTKYRTSNIESHRNDFDNAYKPVLDAIQAMRTANKDICQTIETHKDKVFKGEIVQIQNHAIGISETIDQLLRDSITIILTNGVIAIKGIQKVVEIFGIDIGCLFRKVHNFKTGVAALKSQGHNSLAKFLEDVRLKWSERFILRRDSIEHQGWTLDRVTYKVSTSKKVEMVEPQLDGLPLSAYSQYMLNRVMIFIENIVIYAFKNILQLPIVIIEIPIATRDPMCPKRFCKELKIPGTFDPRYPEWDIIYSENDFEHQ